MTARRAWVGRARAIAASVARRVLTPRGLVLARCLLRGLPVPRWGNLRRVRPFSDAFGSDRGTPVDRHYLHRFLDAHRADIRGDVLEIQSPAYARRYGHDLGVVHTVDINEAFAPTYCCDLADARAIPDRRYDCFLLPATLQGLRDIEACLRHALRVVRPGGVILATSAGLVPLMPDAPDYWRLSDEGWREVTARVWPDAQVEVRAYGNCLSAAASMLGLAAEELTPAEIDARDPRYPVMVSLACRKGR